MKIKKPVIDWIKFDSALEGDIYLAFKNKDIHKLPWCEELKWFKITNPRADKYIIFPSFKCWDKSFRALEYTPDFIIKKWKEEYILEIKSAWSYKKSDFKLRMKLFLYKFWKKLKYMILIKYNNKKYEVIKYF